MSVRVELGERSYDVALGVGVRHSLAELIRARAPRARVAALVTSPTIASQPWFDLASGIEQFVIPVPDGESAKTLAVLSELVNALADRELSRHDVIVAIGGGAITDVAGFAAATYLRGIAFVAVPTSLVGQVDAAIGGKTAVNLPAGKNLMGAFHQPIGVFCDFEALTTLPERERLGGLGEVAKCWLLEERDSLTLASASLEELITMSVALKARIVSGDEREGGRRALLNYGHTLAHALEKISLGRDADELRHGEAVAIGLAFAVRLAHDLGRVDATAIADTDAVLAQLGLSGTLPLTYDVAALLEAMGHDKKAHHDLAFVLPGRDGFALVPGVDPVVVGDVLERFRGEQ